jgi:hypothetical protein
VLLHTVMIDSQPCNFTAGLLNLSRPTGPLSNSPNNSFSNSFQLFSQTEPAEALVILAQCIYCLTFSPIDPTVNPSCLAIDLWWRLLLQKPCTMVRTGGLSLVESVTVPTATLPKHGKRARLKNDNVSSGSNYKRHRGATVTRISSTETKFLSSQDRDLYTVLTRVCHS